MRDVHVARRPEEQVSLLQLAELPGHDNIKNAGSESQTACKDSLTLRSLCPPAHSTSRPRTLSLHWGKFRPPWRKAKDVCRSTSGELEINTDAAFRG